jgi:hypothetical protein
MTDNMSSKAWANKVCTSSVRGQMLLSVYAALLRRSHIGFHCEHIPARSWTYFQPSPELLLVLFSRLSTEVWLDHPKTPSYPQATSVTSLGSWSPSRTVTRGEPTLHKLLMRRVSQASWRRSRDGNSSPIGASPSRSTCTCDCLTTSMHPTVATVQTLGTGLSLTGSARDSMGATASKNGPKTSAIETSIIRSSISLEIREPSRWVISLFVR